jgi:hypothetical protein
MSMIGSAAVTRSRAVIALGLGLSLIPRIAPSVVDGFLVGAVLSAACCLLFVAPRRLLGRLRPPVVPPFADQAAEKLMLEDTALYRERPHLDGSRLANGGRHGLDERAPLTWRSLLGSGSPRHAAPSPLIDAIWTGLTAMAAKFAVRPLPVRN